MAGDADVLVVGAGMAGLMAAYRLQHESDLDVIVVDKGRGVGGRMATRRIDGGRADHGAQFFTVRHERFQKWVDRWRDEGLVYEWARGWSDGSVLPVASDGHPRYVVDGGMAALPKWVARDLDVRFPVRIEGAQQRNSSWAACTEEGEEYSASAVVLTPPVPQSLRLLDAGNVQLADDDRAALEEIEYAPCLAGLFHVTGGVQLPDPGAVQSPDDDITWIADNTRKGISPHARIITVHAGPDYSADHYDDTDEEILQLLRAGVDAFSTSDMTIIEEQLKRWRYALPTAFYNERCLTAQHLPPLVFAGDAFKEPRVEGAALSGLTTANTLLRRLR